MDAGDNDIFISRRQKERPYSAIDILLLWKYNTGTSIGGVFVKKIIYHGSINRIEQPIFGFGKKYNDYGLGFYCTENIELAKEWAVQEEQDGYANIYEIDESGLKILNLCDDNYNCLNWIELLLRHRTFDLSTPISKASAEYLHKNFCVDISDADVVIGYRADDSYFSYAQDFLNNTISCGQLYEALHLGNLGQQYVLKSKKAFNSISAIGYEIALAEEWYRKKLIRDQNARRRYYEMDTMKYIKNDLYILQIIDEEIAPNDKRIR